MTVSKSCLILRMLMDKASGTVSILNLDYLDARAVGDAQGPQTHERFHWPYSDGMRKLEMLMFSFPSE